MKRYLGWVVIMSMTVSGVGLAAAEAADAKDVAVGYLAKPASIPGVDAPELAALGPYTVGVKTVQWVHKNQANPLELNPETQKPVVQDRVLVVDIWYPSSLSPTQTKGLKPAIYEASLPSEVPKVSVSYLTPGIAYRDAPAQSVAFPLVVLSHGYSNPSVALSWLAENLASKGYVIAAIRHQDPDISDNTKVAGPVLRRPLDIAFVAAQMAQHSPVPCDATRTALIGYSMGGYGVLAAGGASFEPTSPLVTQMPDHLMDPYLHKGSGLSDIHVPNVKAIVGLAPAGGGVFGAFGAQGLSEITAPMLLIAGDHDQTVNYTSGARTFFDDAVHSKRYLLTLRGAGHAIGFGPAPLSMQKVLWDIDWFEDPIWRKDRIIAVNLHFITAFLDRHVKNDESKSTYIEGLLPDSDQGIWPLSQPGGYGAFSPGTAEVTVWKGFRHKHAFGMSFETKNPS